MDMYKTYKSPLGYDVKDGKIDSYGVNHQNFSLRDELEYQYERQRRENKIIQGYNNQGITNNYPPQGTGFWGQNPDNNYGFGDSNIASAVETIKQNPLPVMEQSNVSQPPQYWETAADGKKVYDYVAQQEGNVKSDMQNQFMYGASAVLAAGDMYNNYKKLKPIRVKDKYKHALLNCNAAQYGQGGHDIAQTFSLIKEGKDILLGDNTIDSSRADNYANQIGRLLGTKYPQGNCDDLIQKYIKKK